MRGVMLDCSRNGVMKPEAIERYVSLMAKMGYDTLMLYTEETYEVDNEPWFGYMRGRYTKAEMKALDALCAGYGVELVPCIQTLAHLKCMFRWEGYADIRDCDDILLIDEERTYQLIERMFSTLRQCVSTTKIHIGMDEAYRVGMGKYLELHGYADRFQLIVRHLNRVCELAARYGFEPMIWSDMFCKLALNTTDYYQGGRIDQEWVKEHVQLPENVAFIYWDYYTTDRERYARMIEVNKAFGRKVIFAGGAWTWKGFGPDNEFSMRATKEALLACRDEGVEDWFLTSWGDDGDECSKFAVLPALLYAAQIAEGQEDMDVVREKFREIVGAELDTFMLLDQLNIGEGNTGSFCKYLLYNDVFMGFENKNIEKRNNDHYAQLAEKIHNASGKGEYGYLFDACEALCRVLSVKSELGRKTRRCYREGDKEALKRLAAEEYTRVISAVKEFHRLYQRLWMEEKKPHGFDVQDIRLGGLMQRLESCRNRIEEYLRGETVSIPELEEEIMESGYKQPWRLIATCNVMSD
ncbi:MAG: beta-N-acetylhexosaminidase [Lachnospiraceae bacterium]|nr:beta-N-acetylhexosaminidase [Lachnospiraceae bacterium]